MTNDNSSRNLTNKTHSLTLALLGDGSYALSCFKLGADGRADLDMGEVFVKLIPVVVPGHDDALPVASRAEWQWREYAELMSCPVARFEQEIDGTMRAISSLGSCLDREVRNEARILRSYLTDLSMLTLKRRDATREALRASVIARAERTLLDRFEDLDSKIQAEATDRAAKGQP